MHAVHTTRLSFGAATKGLDPTRVLVHLYTIEVSQTDPAASEIIDIQTALQGLVAQLDGRQLELMLAGAAVTPAGIATWTIESLALRFPRLSSVTVRLGTMTDGDEVRVEREISRI